MRIGSKSSLHNDARRWGAIRRRTRSGRRSRASGGGGASADPDRYAHRPHLLLRPIEALHEEATPSLSLGQMTAARPRRLASGRLNRERLLSPAKQGSKTRVARPVREARWLRPLEGAKLPDRRARSEPLPSDFDALTPRAGSEKGSELGLSDCRHWCPFHFVVGRRAPQARLLLRETVALARLGT